MGTPVSIDIIINCSSFVLDYSNNYAEANGLGTELNLL